MARPAPEAVTSPTPSLSSLPAPPACNVILVRYGEIGLKSRSVRARFERRLVDNLLDQLELAGVAATVERPRGRLVVHAEPLEAALEPVSRTFGVVSYSPACRLETTDRETLVELAVRLGARRLAALGSGATFGVKVRRTGSHPYTSMQLAGEAGAAILKAVPEARVQLKNPQVQVSLEVRQKSAYGLLETLSGVGGLPLGSQGKVAALIDSRRAVVAAWLLAKRGCTCELLVARGGEGTWQPELEAFEAWHPRLRVEALDPSEGQAEGRAEGQAEGGAPPLLRQALALATERKARALVLGWDLAAVEELPPEPGLPLFFPLLGLVPEEVAGYHRTLLAQRALATHPLEAPRGSGRRSRA